MLVEGSSRLLRPDEQVFESMLSGWMNQQVARGLKRSTIDPRLRLILRFQRFTNEYPWAWRPADVEEFISSRVSREKPIAMSTIRSDGAAIRAFCDYVSDARYQWVSVCQRLFGEVPVQICFDWNTAAHVSDYEGRPGRRAMTKLELQSLFDLMDDMVATQHKAGSKSWLSTLRDAAAFKTAYAYGLRRRELAMLDLADLGRNPHVPEFGELGVLYVRWGKANKGGAPKRRSVLTVFPWSVTVLREWTDEHRALMPTSARSTALWPSERSARMDVPSLGSGLGSTALRPACPKNSDCTVCAILMSPTSSKTAGIHCSSRSRSVTPTPPPQASTPGCRRTSEITPSRRRLAALSTARSPIRPDRNGRLDDDATD